MYAYFHSKLTPHTLANLIVGVLAGTPSLPPCASQVPQIQFRNPLPKEPKHYTRTLVLFVGTTLVVELKLKNMSTHCQQEVVAAHGLANEIQPPYKNRYMDALPENRHPTLEIGVTLLHHLWSHQETLWHLK